MKTVIPEKRIVTCDMCGRDNAQTSFGTEASVVINRHALDYQGCPVANGGCAFDACDECASSLVDHINVFADARKKK